MASGSIIRLPHLPYTSIHVSLFRDVKNAAFLRKQLMDGNAAFEYAFLDATMVKTQHPAVHPLHSLIVVDHICEPCARCSLSSYQRLSPQSIEKSKCPFWDCLLTESEQQRKSIHVYIVHWSCAAIPSHTVSSRLALTQGPPFLRWRAYFSKKRRSIEMPF